MKRLFSALLLLFTIVTLTSCGGGDHHGPPPLVEVSTVSDPNVDGDIAFDPANNSYTVSQVTTNQLPNIFAGVDPSTLIEYRAFLDFPLTKVPLHAIIQSATLDFVVPSIAPANATIPIRIELVDFPPPVLQPDYYFHSSDSVLPPLASMTIEPPISPLDVGQHVTVDITPLMSQAQVLGLSNLQLRILEDQESGPATLGLVEIDERTDQTAPFLSVVFF